MRSPRWTVAPLLAPLLALLAAAVPDDAAGAQEGSDSLFRAGAWAVQITVGGGAFTRPLEQASVGVLRFASPRRAWMLDAFVEHAQRRQRVVPSPSEVRRETDVTLRGGLRSHTPAGRRVMTFAGAGLLAGYRRDSQGTVVLPTWRGGAYGEFGATFRPSPRFAVGAVTDARLTYARQRVEQGSLRITTTEMRLRVVPARLQVTAVF
jgi:hypothetical protein